MITLEEFTKVLNLIFETEKYRDELEKISKIEFFESPLVESFWKMIDFWVNRAIKEEFHDTFNAYLWPEDGNCTACYERDEEHPLELFYKDGAVNKIGTIEQLYNYIKENDGFRTNS